MGNIKFNKEQQIKIELLKSMLKLVTYWKKEIHHIEQQLKNYQQFDNCQIYKLQNQVLLYQYNLDYIDKIVRQANLDEIEKEILKDVFINKIGNMEKIGRKYFYSDSGMRNKVNMILNKLLKVIDE